MGRGWGQGHEQKRSTWRLESGDIPSLWPSLLYLRSLLPYNEARHASRLFRL